MSPRPYEEVDRDAREGSPFSNGTSWEIWSYNWCERCKNDSPELVDKGEGCPLIMVALMGKTPAEWFPQEGVQDYHCVEFRDKNEGGGGDAPKAPEPIPGQGIMFDMEPHTKMYADVVAEALPSPMTR
jgi:hypothetical protein